MRKAGIRSDDDRGHLGASSSQGRKGAEGPTIVLHPQAKASITRFIRRELEREQQRLVGNNGGEVKFEVDDRVRDFILDDGGIIRFDEEWLRKRINRVLVKPLARLLSTGLICAGDTFRVRLDRVELQVFFERRRA